MQITARDIKEMEFTKKNFKGLTKSEIDEQADDLDSDLNQYVKKVSIKKKNKSKRKIDKGEI